jgi:hypothetical protein
VIKIQIKGNINHMAGLGEGDDEKLRFGLVDAHT